MSLTIDQYEGLIEYMGDVIESESGQVDHRSRVERMARRQKKKR